MPTVLEWHISARSVECSQELSALVDAAGWYDPLACLPSLVSLGPNGPIINEATRDDFDWEMVLAAGPYAPPSDQAQPCSMFWEQSDA